MCNITAKENTSFKLHFTILCMCTLLKFELVLCLYSIFFLPRTEHGL